MVGIYTFSILYVIREGNKLYFSNINTPFSFAKEEKCIHIMLVKNKYFIFAHIFLEINLSISSAAGK